jgi:lipopolysaccharide/colanic/teichoic acid biosynthesis glycosyltransferase
MPRLSPELFARLQPMPIQVIDQEKSQIGRAMDSEQHPAFANGFYANYGKRALDIWAATAGLILLSPVLAIAACCIKLTSRGPVFYRQIRIGQGARPFQILKFRSMTMPTSTKDLKITVAGDSRVTPVGKFFRRYKVDELPQLWNVICGDMSLVGPRPEVPVYIEEYTPEQRSVLSARPGITDPASLAYRHEEEILACQADPEQFYRTKILPDKLARNRAYLEKITLQNDIRIIVKTISSSFLFVEKHERDTLSR